MKLFRFAALALASTPLLWVPTLAQTQKPTTPPAAAKAPASKPSTAVRTVDIVGTDQMKFDLTDIPAKRNEQLRVRLISSKGTMPKIAMAHNWVLLKLGTSQVKFITAGAQARQTDFIAPEMKDQVIAATPLAGAGETVDVTFKVPGVAGSYPYVCTFPGHFQAGMRGNLVVK